MAFLRSARNGEHTDVIVRICTRLAKCEDRFVQLGMGWVLRESYLGAQEASLDFLRAHYPRIKREALRYAIEKMPAGVRARALREHAEANHSVTKASPSE